MDTTTLISQLWDVYDNYQPDFMRMDLMRSALREIIETIEDEGVY